MYCVVLPVQGHQGFLQVFVGWFLGGLQANHRISFDFSLRAPCVDLRKAIGFPKVFSGGLWFSLGALCGDFGKTIRLPSVFAEGSLCRPEGNSWISQVFRWGLPVPPGKTFRALSVLALTCILISRARASPPTSPRSSFRKPERFPSHARAAPLASPSPTPATSLSSCHRKPERLPSQVPNCPSRKTELPPASPISCLCKPERLPSHARAAPSRKPELPFPQARAHPPCKPKIPALAETPKLPAVRVFVRIGPPGTYQR